MTTLRSRLLNTHRDVTDQELQQTVAGKVMLVTGASHGIGRALSERLAHAGAEVLMVARSQDVLTQLAAELGPRAHSCPADLSVPDDVARLLTELRASFATPDFVVSNAGKSIRRSIAESYERMHDFTRTIAINYLGPGRRRHAGPPTSPRRQRSTFGCAALPPRQRVTASPRHRSIWGWFTRG